MSGIAGIFHFDGQPVVPGQIEGMTAAMDYRGPDGITHWQQGNIALGHCMLQSTAESLEEKQPLTSPDGSLVLVLDGRVDNWEALRAELLAAGSRLRTGADAELVLRAYEVWGERCLEHVDGDFAFVLWNARTRTLFCARDRFGNRQFHYHWHTNSFAFATDVHPLLALPWVPEIVDEDTVAEYLATEWITIDTTLWQDVKRLKPAHSLTVSDTGQRNFRKYWAPDPFATLPCKTDDDYIAYYRELFFDVVRRTLRSHKPLAIEVSGGLDSSAIFAAAVHLQREGRLAAPGLTGYTLDFRGDPDADEVDYALSVGEHLGVPIEIVPPTYPELDWYVDVGRRFRTFPDLPNGAMAQGIWHRARSAGSRVLVSGTGGDEWLGGSGVHFAESLAEGRWDEVINNWMTERNALGGPNAMWKLTRHGLAPLLPKRIKDAIRAGVSIAKGNKRFQPDWLSEDMRRRFSAILTQRTLVPMNAMARIGQASQFDKLYDQYWQFGKCIVERQLVNVGLDWSQPYWCRAMIEFAIASPDRVRNRLEVNKWLHRRAFIGQLPEHVCLRPNKAEFSSSYRRHWRALKTRIAEEIAPRHLPWVLLPPLLSVMNRAYTAQSTHWDAGPAWMLFGLDASTAMPHNRV